MHVKFEFGVCLGDGRWVSHVNKPEDKKETLKRAKMPDESSNSGDKRIENERAAAPAPT